MHEKRHFLSYWKPRHDAQITWPYAYYVTLGSRCNGQLELRRRNWYFTRETHKDTAVSVWACQAGFWKSTRTSYQLRSKPHAVFHGVCEIALTEVLATQRGVMRRSKKVSSFELYKFNPLSPHCGLIARELMQQLYLGSSANCYSSRQHSRPAQLTFLSTTRIHSLLKNLRWQPHWLPRLTSLPGKSHDWWRTRDSSLGQPTENKID